MGAHHLEENFALFTLSDEDKSAVLIEFTNARDLNQSSIQKISYAGTKGEHTIRYWGKKNDLPQFREQTVADNNILGALIQTKRDATIGTGLYAYKVDFISDEGKRNIVEVPIPEDAKAFFDRVNIKKYFLDAGKNLYMHSNIFTEFIRKKGGGIYSMSVKDCKYVRMGEQNASGIVDKAYISGSWAQGAYAKSGETEHDRVITMIPMYNPASIKTPKFIYHSGDNLLNDGYYNSPTWWGALNWIELANSIPIFHQKNILNGYTIRFHIRIPRNYFDVMPTTEDAAGLTKAADMAREKREAFMKGMNELLSGVNNAGRAFYSQFDINEIAGKEYPGVSIEPIEVDIKDKALLELWEKSNQAIISSQGIHPTLANIETAGKLSSGSEMRNAFNVFIALRANTPREILLEALDIVKKENGWDPEIFYGFGDTQLTTLDDSPTGTKPVEAEEKAAA